MWDIFIRELNNQILQLKDMRYVTGKLLRKKITLKTQLYLD